MCGRVIRTTPGEVLQQLFDLTSMPEVLPTRYNLAPTDPIPVIREPHRLELLRWGLHIPGPRISGINARAESLSRAVYRDDKRCLVVVDGFYEWRSLDGTKQPYLIARADHAPMALAGLCDDAGGCAIITVPAQGVVATIHDRMPVMLKPEVFAAWLDPGLREVQPMLRAASASDLTCYPVSRAVNNVRNDSPVLLEPVAEADVARGKTLSLF
jgi:putative SOS response-associated peptidase YedK